MKNRILNYGIGLALAFAAAMLPLKADAQNAIKQPAFIQNQQWLDLGNGPLDILPVEGTGNAYTSVGTGIGSGTTTTVTLTATPAIPPCVGCGISCAAGTAGCTFGVTSIVTAFNGTTTITTNTSQTVAASTPLTWGAACPAATATNTPGVNPNTVTSLSSPLPVRSGSNNAFPIYTLARLCMYGSFQNGLTFLYFPIGAH